MHRTHVVPTPLGWRTGLLLAVFVLAFLATSYNNPFFALISWLGILAVLGAWWTMRNVGDVTIARCSSAACPADVPRQLTLELSSTRRRHDLEVALEIDGAWVPITLPATNERSATISATLGGLARGIRPVQRCRIESRWPFGLFRARRTVALDAELVTWPKSTESNAAQQTFRTSTRRDQQVAGIRPFRSGDAVGDIHWKAMARTGKPVIRERESFDPVDLELDRRCDEPELERRLSSTAAAILAAAAEDRPVRLRSHDYSADTATRTSIDDLMRWLAGASVLTSEEGGAS